MAVFLAIVDASVQQMDACLVHDVAEADDPARGNRRHSTASGARGTLPLAGPAG
jgi:hypothetical protein